jgi:hypothetical protein
MSVGTYNGAAIAVTTYATKWTKNRWFMKKVKTIDMEPFACRQGRETTLRARPRPPQAAATGGTAW